MIHKINPYISKENVDFRLKAWIQSLDGTPGRRKLPPLAGASLLLLDLQRLFIDSDSPAFQSAWYGINDKIDTLIKQCQEVGFSIRSTQHLNPEYPGIIEHFGGRPIPDHLAELSIVPKGAQILTKSVYSVWDKLINITSPGEVIIIAGVTTHRCVLANALDAGKFNRIPVVVADACVSSSEDLHLSALKVLSCGHAYISTVEEIIRCLKR